MYLTVTSKKDSQTLQQDLQKLEQWENTWEMPFNPSPHTDTNVSLIETVQRRAARWVTHDYSSYSSVTQMINTLGWRSLEQRRADARLLTFYKIVHGLVEISLPTYIQRQIRITRTTHSYHFIQIKTTSNHYKYSFFPLAIVQWNNLPHSAVLLEDLTSFRSAILSVALTTICHIPGIIVFISF